MPRQLRMEYPGAIYQVMNRGDRREPIFHDDFDRQRFVAALSPKYRDAAAARCSADIRVCGFTGHSCSVFPAAGDWKVARTRRLESLRYGFVRSASFGFGLSEVCVKTDWQVHAYCLMNNLSIWWSRRPRQIWWPGCAGFLALTRRGWCLGGETFKQELLEQAHQRTGDSRVAKLKVETEEQNEFNLE